MVHVRQNSVLVLVTYSVDRLLVVLISGLFVCRPLVFSAVILLHSMFSGVV